MSSKWHNTLYGNLSSPQLCIIIFVEICTMWKFAAIHRAIWQLYYCDIISTAFPRITSFTATPNPLIGQRFTISCTVSGIPQPTITWRKDGLPLENTNTGLRIVFSIDGKTSSVEVLEGRPEFNGVYECIATNSAGSVKQESRIELQGWAYLLWLILHVRITINEYH